VKVSFQADADLNENIVRGVVRREPRLTFRPQPRLGCLVFLIWMS
jgi:hypothetical protein